MAIPDAYTNFSIPAAYSGELQRGVQDRINQNAIRPRAGTPDETAEGRLAQILRSARGDASRYAADPVDALLMQQLRSRVTGGGPYDETTINALMTQAGANASHVQQNQLANIQGGGNPTDPSVQSQIAEANAARQSMVQQAQLGINQVANLTNYDAKGQAIGQLAGFNQGRQSGQTERDRYINSILGQVNDLRQTPSAGSAMNYMPRPATSWGGPELLPASGNPPGRSDGQQNPVNYGDLDAARAAADKANEAARADAARRGQTTDGVVRFTNTAVDPNAPVAAYQQMGYQDGFVARNRPQTGVPFTPNGRY